MRIFFDFRRNVMGTSVKHLRCHRQGPLSTEPIEAFRKTFGETRMGETINYGLK
jgi:hypothetical protein